MRMAPILTNKMLEMVRRIFENYFGTDITRIETPLYTNYESADKMEDQLLDVRV